VYPEDECKVDLNIEDVEVGQEHENGVGVAWDDRDRDRDREGQGKIDTERRTQAKKSET